jgi:WD40 repeat protein
LSLIRKSISRRYNGVFNLQDRIRSTFSSCGSLVFSGSEDGQVNCWHTYNGNLIYSFKSLNYTQPVLDLQFHPFDNLLAMCSIGPLHQVYVFQHTFNDADIEAKPIQQQTTMRGGLLPPASIMSSDSEQKTRTPISNRHDDSGRYTTVSDTDRSARKGRTESSGDELPRTNTSRNDRSNRRLAVVNKILDKMDDVIVSKHFYDRTHLFGIFAFHQEDFRPLSQDSMSVVDANLCNVTFQLPKVLLTNFRSFAFLSF